MKVIENSEITAFDCDNTLVIWPEDFYSYKKGRIEFIYGDEKVYLIPHSFHPVFLKNCSNRGDYIIVWSQNKVEWVKQVIEKLELTEYVDLAMSKPNRHIDDKEIIEHIVGSRVFIPHKENPK